MTTQTPKGVKDLLPKELKKRKKVISRIAQIFEGYGYEQIDTPTFELYSTLSKALPEDLKNNSFRFFDHDGKQMIMRPDITTSVARVVATRMKKVKGPIKLYYAGDVYRAKHPEIGQDNQFFQIGIELFDMSQAVADKEILTIVEKVLKEVGLKNYEIAKTSVDKIKKLKPAERIALRKQDFVALGRLPKRDELVSVDLDYYTGLYVECYVPEYGYILGSGGRYDNLTEKFGSKRNSVGFAFNLGRLMLALEAQQS